MKKRPHDGSIQLAPGESLHLDDRVNQDWHDQQRNIRLIRGTILVLAFDIEYLIDRLISRALGPSPKPKLAEDSVLESIFDTVFLDSRVTGFNRKIGAFREICQKVPSLSRPLSSDFWERLKRCQTLRNRFAHYPIVFTPVGTIPDQKLVPKLCCEPEEVLLDETYLQESAKLFTSVTDEIQSAVDVCEDLLGLRTPTNQSASEENKSEP